MFLNVIITFGPCHSWSMRTMSGHVWKRCDSNSAVYLSVHFFCAKVVSMKQISNESWTMKQTDKNRQTKSILPER